MVQQAKGETNGVEATINKLRDFHVELQAALAAERRILGPKNESVRHRRFAVQRRVNAP
jgi:hypothetical protein